MAQIELRFFAPFDVERKISIARLSKIVVAKVHYDIDKLSPGDITLVVPHLDTDLSDSDAAYELEVSEGSDNWPRGPLSGALLSHDLAKEALEKRAQRISDALSETFASDAHNVFEVTGIATGWVQYKPEARIKPSQE